MMTEIFQAFKGTTPSASVRSQTLALTSAPTIVKGEKVTDAPSTETPEASTIQPKANDVASREATDVASRGQPSHTEGEHVTQATPISYYQPLEAT